MTDSHRLLLVEQVQAHLPFQVLLLLAVAEVVEELPLELPEELVGQAVAGVHLLLVMAALLLRLGKEMLVDRILQLHQILEAVAVELERREILMGKVREVTEQLLLFPVL
jgi:hypothetical protein